jgi:N-acetylglucosamine-6-phosphate deacetylase
MEELLTAAGDTLRLVTLAPELPGALELVELLVERGVVVSIGHSDATWQQATAAIDRGATLATHAFNAMRPLHHREPGILGAVLTDDRVTAEVIADGVHVSGPALQLLWRTKGRVGRLCLMTDCTAALDAPPGQARLGAQPVEVREGAVRLADGTLAGSSLTMDRAVALLVELAGAPLEGALHAATGGPAAVLQPSEPGAGELDPGAPADLVLLDDNLEVQRVLVGGQWLAP